MKNSFCYRGAVLWNSLPIGLRQAKLLVNFVLAAVVFYPDFNQIFK